MVPDESEVRDLQQGHADQEAGDDVGGPVGAEHHTAEGDRRDAGTGSNANARKVVVKLIVDKGVQAGK